MIARTMALAIALSFVCSTAHASLLTNGDFETGDFTGWTHFTTTNGAVGTPTVTSFDVTGSGASLAARFVVGQITFESGVHRGGGIFQDVLHTGGDLTVTLDLASENIGGSNASGGRFQLLIDGVVEDSHDTGFITGGTTERASLSATVTNASVGTHEIRILITRPFLQSGPRQYVDNVVANSSSNVIPEPATIAIWSVIGMAGVGLGYRQRRKKKAAA